MNDYYVVWDVSCYLSLITAQLITLMLHTLGFPTEAGDKKKHLNKIKLTVGNNTKRTN
jgi:hypothetical protein